jgi:hypothetical protein
LIRDIHDYFQDSGEVDADEALTAIEWKVNELVRWCRGLNREAQERAILIDNFNTAKGLRQTPVADFSIRNRTDGTGEPTSSLYLGEKEIALLLDEETGDLFDLLCELHNSDALSEIERLQAENAQLKATITSSTVVVQEAYDTMLNLNTKLFGDRAGEAKA